MIRKPKRLRSLAQAVQFFCVAGELLLPRATSFQHVLLHSSGHFSSPHALSGFPSVHASSKKSAFKRTLHQRQGIIAAKMGVLRVLTPETIPVECSEPVDPKALETATAVINSIRFLLFSFALSAILGSLCHPEGQYCNETYGRVMGITLHRSFL